MRRLPAQYDLIIEFIVDALVREFIENEERESPDASEQLVNLQNNDYDGGESP